MDVPSWIVEAINRTKRQLRRIGRPRCVDVLKTVYPSAENHFDIWCYPPLPTDPDISIINIYSAKKSQRLKMTYLLKHHIIILGLYRFSCYEHCMLSKY